MTDNKNLGFFDRLLLQEQGKVKKPRAKTVSPATTTTTTTHNSSSLTSPRVIDARSQFYSKSVVSPREEKKETMEPTKDVTSEQNQEQPQQGVEPAQQQESGPILSTSDIIAKFKQLDKQAAESIPPPLRQSDDKAFTVKPIRDDPIVMPNRIAPKMVSTSETIGVTSKPQRSSNSVRTTNQEWRGSLFDRLISPEAAPSPKKTTNTTPRDMNEVPSSSPAKKRTIDFSNKVSRLNFSPDVIKHFEELTSEEARSLDYNFFVMTYDFDNNKKSDVQFVDKGKGLDALREKLQPNTVFHAIYRVELVVGNDLPNFIKYFLLTWTGEQVSNLKRAHATSNVMVFEQFFECAFATVHIINTGPELQDDLERALSNVHHVQTLWQ
jgi:hypothetical protein